MVNFFNPIYGYRLKFFNFFGYRLNFWPFYAYRLTPLRPPCICDNDPGTSSVVASPFCLAELCLAIFFARIFLFSRCRERNRSFMPLELVGSVQNKEEPPAHFKKRFCLFLTLQKVTMGLKTL